MKILRKKFFSHSRGSALLIGLIITVLLSVLVTAFVEKALRAGVSVKGIEQSTQAYYLATSIIEKQLQNTTNLKKQPWSIVGNSEGTLGSSYSGAILEAHTKSTTIPEPGKGNSPFDKDFNIISMNDPIQLVIPSGLNFSNTKFLFRIPAVSQDGSITPQSTNTGVIFFSFGNSEKSFYLDKDQLIRDTDIENSFITISGKKGFTYNAHGQKQPSGDFATFYRPLNCGNDSDIKCVLKFSLIKPVIANNNIKYPFLEYKIDNFSKQIPLQFMTLESRGWVGKYLRERIVEIPQITTNTALDFAVLQ